MAFLLGAERFHCLRKPYSGKGSWGSAVEKKLPGEALWPPRHFFISCLGFLHHQTFPEFLVPGHTAIGQPPSVIHLLCFLAFSDSLCRYLTSTNSFYF